MQYESTRGQIAAISAEQAIVQGIAQNGGLFVPSTLPTLTQQDLHSLAAMSYQECAEFILKQFLPNFSPAEISNCVHSAYNDSSFDVPSIAPLVALQNGTYIQELWHGPTCAFKDMALQILPHLLTTSAKKIGEQREICILVATSGDTGKAALEGFCNVPGTKVVVYYPVDGVSQVQKRQMMTQEGKNVEVLAVEGNFDDAQNGVKQILGDTHCAAALHSKNIVLSSANSINWGRLLPQMVYYVYACVTLLKNGKITMDEKVNFVVPTGNFGNILAAFYAKELGLPIGKLICASNANNVLTEFIRTGRYDRNRAFHKTVSPSMDILISSNLERLLYELSDHDGTKVAGYMQELTDKGFYQVDSALLGKMQELFYGACADDVATQNKIGTLWQGEHYLADTHTAVALSAYDTYQKESGDHACTVVMSTANPYKFVKDVAVAIDTDHSFSYADEFALLYALAAKTGVPIPKGLQGLSEKPILHSSVCTKQAMQEVLLRYLQVNGA